MIIMKIDATCYPVIKVQSIDKPVVPRMALYPLEFDPSPGNCSDFLLYFRELEDD